MASAKQIAWRKKFARLYGKKGSVEAKIHSIPHAKETARRKKEGTAMGIKRQIEDMRRAGMSKAEIKKLLLRDTKIYIDKYL